MLSFKKSRILFLVFVLIPFSFIHSEPVDSAVKRLMLACSEKNIPVIFALSRNLLGKSVFSFKVARKLARIRKGCAVVWESTKRNELDKKDDKMTKKNDKKRFIFSAHCKVYRDDVRNTHRSSYNVCYKIDTLRVNCFIKCVL